MYVCMTFCVKWWNNFLPLISYVLRRLRHSLGEVCCLCIDEIVSFPAEANIKVRLVAVGQTHAHMLSDAQAFLSIKKI